MLRRQFKALIEMLQEQLRAIQEAIQEHNTTNHDAEEAADIQRREIPRITASLVNSEEDRERTTADREQTHREQQALIASQNRTAKWTRNAFIAAVLYGLVAGIQGYLMWRTYTEIETQTRLQRDQLVGTESANIYVAQAPGNGEESMHSWRIVIVNHGGVAGTINHFHATIQRRSMATGHPIGSPVPVEFSNDVVGKASQDQINRILPWRLPEIGNQSELRVTAGETDIPRPWLNGEMVIVNGSYSYNDGFDDTIIKPICFLWVPHWSIYFPGMAFPQTASGGWSGGLSSPVCPTLQEEMDRFEFALHDAKRMWESQKPRTANKGR